MSTLIEKIKIIFKWLKNIFFFKKRSSAFHLEGIVGDPYKGFLPYQGKK